MYGTCGGPSGAHARRARFRSVGDPPCVASSVWAAAGREPCGWDGEEEEEDEDYGCKKCDPGEEPDDRSSEPPEDASRGDTDSEDEWHRYGRMRGMVRDSEGDSEDEGHEGEPWGVD